ncbi:7402_t:CDS:2, partial [Funneliformis geosporum]
EDESVSDYLLVSETFVDYSPLKYELYQDKEKETATKFLIKFMKLVLTEIDGDKFNRFPSTLYLAKKLL